MENVNLTRSGVMMSNGIVISTDVAVDVLTDGSVRMHYTDGSNTLKTDVRSTTDNGITLMRNNRGVINSVLSRNDDYLVLWGPKESCLIDNCF
jgi:hypothetical protein